MAKPMSGSLLGNSCAGCHGTRGMPQNPQIPVLAGANSTEFIKAMHAYRDGSRRGTVMNRVARAYADDEIKAMADYFASFPKMSIE